MKRTPPPSVFLERRSYRRRRMMDALRLLPILGGMLFMLPLFWPNADGTGADAVPMSTAVIYVFVVWMLLILGSFALWRVLWFGRIPEAPDPDAADDGEAL